jgi:hypothetical protein
MYSPEDDKKSETWLVQSFMYISVMQARHMHCFRANYKAFRASYQEVIFTATVLYGCYFMTFHIPGIIMHGISECYIP